MMPTTPIRIQFRILNMVRDAVGLVYALGYRSIAAVVGHDAGAPVAAWSALIRPDVFRSVAILSSPFAGAAVAAVQHRQWRAPPRPAPTDDELDAELASLPRPRKYYQNYQRTPGADDDMLHAPQGLHAFFRAYYHYKSADWKGNKDWKDGNRPFPLKARTAEELAKIPTYYVMDLDKGMAATAAAEMPSAAEIAANKWLTEAEVEVYATEYGRTGFTGALQGYRVRRGSDPKSIAEMLTFSGRTIDVPSMFIAGKSDWGVYQTPRRGGSHAQQGAHPHAGVPPDRRRRPLGAAGAARTGVGAADGFLKEFWPTNTIASEKVATPNQAPNRSLLRGNLTTPVAVNQTLQRHVAETSA